MELATDLRYADAGRLWGEIVGEALRPKKRITVDECAAAHRWLANEGGGHVGRWDPEIARYLIDPQRSLDDRRYSTTAIVGPAQCGKTEVAQNWLLKSVGFDPADLLWYMQTDAGLEAFVKKRIDTMIRAHRLMQARLGRRPMDNSLHFKAFDAMSVEFLSATYSNIISKSAGRIVGDEIDAYDVSLGDVKVLFDQRRRTYGEASKLLMISHCDRAGGMRPKDWNAGIMAVYRDSTRFVWWWPCPQCGEFCSPAPTASRVMTLDYPAKADLDEIAGLARLVCHNGCAIEDEHRAAMNARGFWAGLGEEVAPDGTVTGELVKSPTAGYWIVGVMSPFIPGGIGALARARAKAEREYEAGADESEQTLRTVIVKDWGLPYEPPRALGSLDANALAENADPRLKLGEVPEDVRFLVAFVDVQANRFEVIIRGFGERAESWIVDYFVLEARPATSARDWDALLERLARPVPLAGQPGRGMLIRGVGYDSAGEPGVTTQAGDAWLRAKAAGRVKAYGKISGRDVWSIIPAKGAATPNAPRLVVSYPDSQRKGRLASHGAVPQLMFNPNLFKDDLAGQLALIAGEPWSVHFPAALKSDPPPHLFFEQLLAEKRGKLGRWAKPNNSVRNEALDLMVGSHAVARLHGIGRINWTKPPAWAADRSANSMIVPLAPAAALPVGDTPDPTDAAANLQRAPAKRRSILDVLR